MIVRLMLIGGSFRFVWFVPADCADGVEGLPILVRPGAYRRSIYRDPNVSRDIVNRRFVRIENAPAGPRDGLTNNRVRSVGSGASGEATTLEIEAQTPSQPTSRVASNCGPSDPDGKSSKGLNTFERAA